jgi:hypothetical protein
MVRFLSCERIPNAIDIRQKVGQFLVNLLLVSLERSLPT